MINLSKIDCPIYQKENSPLPQKCSGNIFAKSFIIDDVGVRDPSQVFPKKLKFNEIDIYMFKKKKNFNFIEITLLHEYSSVNKLQI